MNVAQKALFAGYLKSLQLRHRFSEKALDILVVWYLE